MKKKIGIKYCGGCNPKYDRVTFVNELLENHPNWSPLYLDDILKSDEVYIVNGCERACANTSSLKDKKITIVTNENYKNIK